MSYLRHRATRKNISARQSRRAGAGKLPSSHRQKKPLRLRRTIRHTGRRSGATPFSAFDPTQFINTQPVTQPREDFTPLHAFRDFGLHERLTAVLESRGLVHPTPIQDKAIPAILEGCDVVGIAETGTGKTAAFLLPLLHRLFHHPRQLVLILAPTRELAIQINQELVSFAGAQRDRTALCVGGVPLGPQMRALCRRIHFVIGTPGRVQDLIRRRAFNPAHLTHVVLDEADRMLDMGFLNPMRTILTAAPRERSTLFFSATMPPPARRLVAEFLRDPLEISVKKSDAASSIAQNVVPYAPDEKLAALCTILRNKSCQRALVFGATKRGVERLQRNLGQEGISAVSLHGNKTHRERQRALGAFKRGAARVLVATDIAARGIHVENISHVINYDLPNTREDYIHRIGRTGRGAQKGVALTLVPKRRRAH